MENTRTYWRWQWNTQEHNGGGTVTHMNILEVAMEHTKNIGGGNVTHKNVLEVAM